MKSAESLAFAVGFGEARRERRVKTFYGLKTRKFVLYFLCVLRDSSERKRAGVRQVLHEIGTG